MWVVWHSVTEAVLSVSVSPPNRREEKQLCACGPPVAAHTPDLVVAGVHTGWSPPQVRSEVPELPRAIAGNRVGGVCPDPGLKCCRGWVLQTPASGSGNPQRSVDVPGVD